jgi:hypothetical protein
MRAPLMLASLVALALPAAAQRAPEPEPAWRTSAMVLVPAGYVAGDAYRTDETAMTGYLAIYPVGGDDPKSPASVFAPRLALIVRLARENGALRAIAAETKPREDAARGNRDTTMTDPDGNEDDVGRRHADLAASRDRLPPGTEPCDLGARSADRDPHGLNVRAAPSASSKILGTLPPPFKFKAKGRENTPEGGWLTEFRIIGFKDGWFLIEGATPPGKDYEDDSVYPRNAPKPYAGRGWVAANKVGANFAYSGTRTGGLFQAPFADASWTPSQDKSGNAITADGGPQRILACSGLWGLVEANGVRGWWRSLCSNQVTNRS